MSENSIDFFLDIPRTLSTYRINENLCQRIRDFSPEAHSLIPRFLEEMQEWLVTTEMFKVLNENQNIMHQFKQNQEQYWEEFFAANINREYLDSRFRMGTYYANSNLPLSDYCALISFRLSWWTNTIYQTKKNDQEKNTLNDAFKKLIMLDTATTCVAYSEATNLLIESQSKTLLQLSTPTIQLWDGILLLPIVGVLDSVRAQNMMDELLKRTVSTSSPVSIIDIVAVPNVDSSVANHLIKIVKATKLLGGTCILSGISPEVAQALVEVGINLDEVHTTSTLRMALKVGLEMLGLTITTAKEFA